MARAPLAALVALVSPLAAAGQAVTEWFTTRGVPISVVEVAGADVAHVATLVPPETAVPAQLGGFQVETRPTALGVVVEVTVPVFAAVPALAALGAALEGRGAGALVVLGGTPARELAVAGGALEKVPLVAAPRRACLWAEGNVSLLRGSPERLELLLPLPGPDDPRWDLLPALEAWLRRRLAQRWAALTTSLDLRDACPRLAIRVPSPTEPPRAVLPRLREAIRELAAATPTQEEVEAVASSLDRWRAGWAVDGRTAARELVLRRAAGGRVASTLAPPYVDAEALAALARSVLGGQAGEAVVVETERRPVEDAPEELENGVLLAWRWVPSVVGVVGVALGGVDPELGEGVLGQLASEAAREGWHALLDTVAGVPAIALAVPVDDLPAVLEAVASTLGEAAAGPAPGGGSQVVAALALATEISGSTVAVAVWAPPEADVVREAAVKFFSGLPPAKVRSTVPLSPGLTQLTGAGEAVIHAVLELPLGLPGWLAGHVLAGRWQRLGGTRVRWLAPAGRLVLELTASSDGHVPGLDARLATLWPTLCAPATAEEAAGAAAQLRARLYGDPARAAMRTAAALFFPHLPRQEELLGVEAEEISGALASLPAWAQLPRLGRGPEPLLAAPPPGPGVRKSPPRRPRGPGGG